MDFYANLYHCKCGLNRNWIGCVLNFSISLALNFAIPFLQTEQCRDLRYFSGLCC